MRYHFPSLSFSDFYEDPDSVREFALKLEYHNKCGSHPGLRTNPLDTIDPNVHRDILDLACGSGVLLEYCKKRFPVTLRLCGVDMNDNELRLARSRLLNKDINFFNAKAQELNFIKDSSKDVIFCHWALTLMDPVVPVLKTIKRILKNNGVFSAIVDGDSNSAPGYLEIYNI